MVDSDLGALYGVKVKRLNESAKRNTKHFPPEFMFQLTAEEWKNLRSQIVIFKDRCKYTNNENICTYAALCDFSKYNKQSN